MRKLSCASRLAGVLVALLFAAAAQAGERVALLIGNSEYSRPEMALPNPQNDSRALGAALRRMGFRVTVANNQTLDQMETALAEFEQTARDAEFALFFYAGHGVQIKGENYLIGTGLANTASSELNRASLKMSAVRAAFENARPQIGMLILDACRNNPFTDSGEFPPGLVRTRGGAGLLIAYATDPGNVAYDGIGENSVFTKALLDNIETPGLDVRLMLGRVRQQVLLETRGQQIPWVEEAVLGEHYFVPAAPGAAPPDAVADDMALWRTVSGKADPQALRRYLEAYPNGLFAEFARDRISRLAAAERAPRAPSPDPERTSAAMILASADLTQVSAALTALGLLSGERDLTRALPEDIAPALEGYRQQLADPSALNLEQLFTDATRLSMFMGATTLQRIRTDIVALRSVERTLTVANDALNQIAAIAADNPAALPVLQQAKNDVDAIRLSRAQILRRLDYSRTTYDEILQRAAAFVPPTASVALIGSDERARELNPNIDRRFEQDAGLFLKHVFQTDDSRKGSYAWMTDLLPQS